MSVPTTDIITPTTNTTNLYTTIKSTNFKIYDGKEITETPRPTESKIQDGEQPPNALYPSTVIPLPVLATEKCNERSISIYYNDTHIFYQDNSIFFAHDATQFGINIVKDPFLQKLSKTILMLLIVLFQMLQD